MDSKIRLLDSPALHLGKSIFRGRLDAENYIDMGLPSGTKWAPSNLDLKTETGLAASPFQYECSFFSWGNVEGHNPVSESAFDYNFGGVNQAVPWYEGQPYGDTPGNTLTGNIPINTEFDAARALLGDPWRMPLDNDFQELIDNCIYIDGDGNEVDAAQADKRVNVNSIRGIYLQSKTNGNRLFFAATGNGSDSSWIYRGTNGSYWSRAFYSAHNARNLLFGIDGVDPKYVSSRYIGSAVRPIIK